MNVRRWFPPTSYNRLVTVQLVLLGPFFIVSWFTPYVGPALVVWAASWAALSVWNREAWKRHFRPRTQR